MSTLTIRNLNKDVKQSLRERAASHGHSMEEEARRILKDVLDAPPRPVESGVDLLQRIRARLAPLGGGIDLELPERQLVREPPSFE